jgi:DNA-binding SARP family transcriptional activator
MARLHLSLLGGFRARLEPGGPISLPTRKAQALLAYLALPAGRAHPRDKLAALLWGDVRETQGRASLRQVLSAVRRATERVKALRLEAETVALAPGAIEIDVDRFERAVRRATPEALEEASALYQGDLLAGLALREPSFEEWLFTERERLRELAMEALARLLIHRRDSGAVEDAIQVALRLLALDPLQESVHRTLMRLYVQAGRRGAALRQYQACVTVLERELRAQPEVETRAVRQDVLRTPARPVRAADGGAATSAAAPAALARPDVAPRDVPLVGREAEMARIEEALDRTWAGDGLALGLDGEAGIGKSRLAAEAAARAQRRGGRVLVGRCYETEQILPYGPWLDALRSAGIARDAALLDGLGPVWRAELARLLPEAAGAEFPAGAGSEPARAFEAVAQVLERLAAGQPLVVVLKDLQWADETNVRLAAFLGRRLQNRPVLLLATGRTEEMRDAPLLRGTRQELERAGRIVTLDVSRLSREATLALAGHLLPIADARRGGEALDEAIWRVSEGNPFVVVETLRALPAAPATGASGGLPLPARVRVLVTHRLARLGERARRLVDVAAVIGRQFDFALLRAAAEASEDDAATGLEELVRAHVLHQSGDGFAFVHDRLREVAYAEILGPRRALLHRRVAEALEARRTEDLDRHALAIGTHYRAAGAAEKAAASLVRASVAALAGGAAREALACCEQAMAALGPGSSSAEGQRLRSDLHLQAGHACFWLGELERAMTAYRQAGAAARALGDDDRLARVGVALTRLLGADARYREALETGEQALAIVTRLGDRGLEVWARSGLCPTHFALGNYGRAAALARETLAVLPGAALGERPAAAGVLPGVSAMGWLAQCAARLGAFEEALRWGDEALGRAEAAHHHPASAFARYSLGHAHLARGDFAAALVILEPAVELALAPIRPRVLATLAAAHARSGRLLRASALLDEALATVRSTRLLYGHSLTLIHLAMVHLLADRVKQAEAAVGEALVLTRERGQRGDEGWALLVRAEVAARLTGPAAGAADLRAALAVAETLAMRPLAARCRLQLGSAAARAGDAATAHAELTAAAEAFAAMGMTSWREAARGLVPAALPPG